MYRIIIYLGICLIFRSQKHSDKQLMMWTVDKEATQEPLSGFVSVHPSLVKTDEQVSLSTLHTSL